MDSASCLIVRGLRRSCMVFCQPSILSRTRERAMRAIIWGRVARHCVRVAAARVVFLRRDGVRRDTSGLPVHKARTSRMARPVFSLINHFSIADK